MGKTTIERNSLVEEAYPLVRAIAGNLARSLPRSIDKQDLVQVGVMALLDAAERFDPSQGTTFSMYARHRVRGAMLNWLGRDRYYPARHEQIPESARSTERSPCDRAEAAEAAARLAVALAALPERDRRILTMIYAAGEPLCQVAAMLGLSRARVCQIHTAALGKLRASLAA